MTYTQITKSQLRQRLRERLPVIAFYLDAELDALAMEALRVYNAITGYWKARRTLPTVASQSWYTLGGTITSSMRVAWNGKPLTPCAIADLDAGRRYWESETTSTGGEVPREPKLWGIGGLNCIAIWPADAAAGNSLLVDGIAATPSLSTDDSYLDIGLEELSHLLAYIEHVALFKEGGKEFAESLPLLQTFLKGAAGRSAMLLASAPFRAAMGLDADERAKRPDRTSSGEGRPR